MKNKKNFTITTKAAFIMLLIVGGFMAFIVVSSLISMIINGHVDYWLLWALALVPAVISVGYYWLIFSKCHSFDETGDKRTTMGNVGVWFLLALPFLLLGMSEFPWVLDAMNYEYTIGDIMVTFPKEFGSSSLQKDSAGEPWIITYIKNDDEDNNHCLIDFGIYGYNQEERFEEQFASRFTSHYSRFSGEYAKVEPLEDVEINGKTWKYFELAENNKKYSMYALNIDDNFYIFSIDDYKIEDELCNETTQEILDSIKYK